mmetsp:Transcript_21582/g.60080  ORF Transcript_21582/g.60080 Transcript_21582/m.60080 type:complete len:217 (+) Transcript_21582:348-998(+)
MLYHMHARDQDALIASYRIHLLPKTEHGHIKPSLCVCAYLPDVASHHSPGGSYAGFKRAPRMQASLIRNDHCVANVQTHLQLKLLRCEQRIPGVVCFLQLSVELVGVGHAVGRRDVRQPIQIVVPDPSDATVRRDVDDGSAGLRVPAGRIVLAAVRAFRGAEDSERFGIGRFQRMRGGNAIAQHGLSSVLGRLDHGEDLQARRISKVRHVRVQRNS